MSNLQFPFLIPPTSQELFSLCLGAILISLFYLGSIHDVKPKQTVWRTFVILIVVTIFCTIFFWRV